MLSPAFLCQDPGPIRHRWLVPHVLTMATLKIGHPITIFVQMKSNDGLNARMNLPYILVIDSLGICYTRSRERMLTRTEEYA